MIKDRKLIVIIELYNYCSSRAINSIIVQVYPMGLACFFEAKSSPWIAPRPNPLVHIIIIVTGC